MTTNTQPVGIDSFLCGYVEVMLFANTFAETANGEMESEDVRGEVEPDEATLAAARADCVDFLDSLDGDPSRDENPELVAEFKRYVADYSFEDAGQDFALSRNGHGAGFFDKNCHLLQRHAKVWGSSTWIAVGGTATMFE